MNRGWTRWTLGAIMAPDQARESKAIRPSTRFVDYAGSEKT
jgi:hypothetical protein